MLRLLLKTLVCSSKTSLLNVVKRPFRSGGIFYPVGSVIKDPSGIYFFRTKVKNGIIVQVDEHNLDKVADYLLHRRGVDVKDKLTKRLELLRKSQESNDEPPVTPPATDPPVDPETTPDGENDGNQEDTPNGENDGNQEDTPTKE